MVSETFQGFVLCGRHVDQMMQNKNTESFFSPLGIHTRRVQAFKYPLNYSIIYNPELFFLLDNPTIPVFLVHHVTQLSPCHIPYEHQTCVFQKTGLVSQNILMTRTTESICEKFCFDKFLENKYSLRNGHYEKF